MSSNQRLRIIVMTCGISFVLIVFGYGVSLTYRSDPFMIVVSVIVGLLLIAMAVLTVRQAGKRERELGQALANRRAMRIIGWCFGISFLLKLLSLAIERIAA